jgi:hypothetical protein
MRSHSAHLPLPATFEQPQVHIEAVQCRRVGAHPDRAMQQPSALERMRRDVEVLLGENRVPRQHRVAVMAVMRSRVLAVRDLAPHLVGDEFVLRLDRPVVVPRRMTTVYADDLLQEHDVGGQTVEPVAQLVDHHPPRLRA